MRLFSFFSVPVALALTVGAAASSTAVPAAAWELLPRACHPVHVVQVAGSGFSHSQAVDLPTPLLFDLWNPGETLQEKFGVNNVGAISVAYPASLGRVNAFSPTPGGHEAYTYGESVKLGTKAAQLELETVASQCPETKFLIVGYSQGASVAGDVAANISAGQVAGLSPDSVAGVVLVADPGRSATGPKAPSRPSVIYGPIPPGVTAQGGEIINGGTTGVLEGRTGMTGARAGNFHNLRGKVLSLCDSRDMACSTPPGSVMNRVAQHANRVEWTGPVDSTGGELVLAIQNALQRGADITPTLQEHHYGLAHLPALLAVLEEIYSYYQVLDADFGKLALTAVLNAAPQLAYEGASNEYLVRAADAAENLLADSQLGPWAGLLAESLRAVSAAELLYWQLFHLHLVPRVTTPEQARQAWVRDRATELASFGPRDEDFILAGKFGYAHMTYFRHGFYVDGQLGYRYADAWLEEVTRAVLAGNSELLR